MKRPRRFVEDDEEEEEEIVTETAVQAPTPSTTPNARISRIPKKSAADSVTKRISSDFSPTDASPYSKRDRQPKTTSDEFIGGMQALIPKVRKIPLSPAVLSSQPAVASKAPSTPATTSARRLAATTEVSPIVLSEPPSIKKTRGRKPKQLPATDVNPLPDIPSKAMSAQQPTKSEHEASKGQASKSAAASTVTGAQKIPLSPLQPPQPAFTIAPAPALSGPAAPLVAAVFPLPVAAVGFTSAVCTAAPVISHAAAVPQIGRAHV